MEVQQKTYAFAQDFLSNNYINFMEHSPYWKTHTCSAG